MKLDSFREDLDDKMVTKGMLVEAVIIWLIGISLALIGLDVAAGIGIGKDE